jgi:hypothetical protein
MTNRQKIEAIKKEPSVLAEALTAEEAAFLDREWDERSEEEKQLFYTAWKEQPDTIDHAAHHTGCSPAELKIAAKVVRAIRGAWIAASDTAANEFRHILASELLEVIERAAAEEQPNRDNLKPCPFCGGESHIIWNARRTARTGTGRKEVTGALVYCTVCSAEIFTTNLHLAADMWNIRSEGGEATAEE